MSEDHYLDDYLAETLPTLGLDAETYAPYVTGYANENDDDGNSLDDLIELLRASSESHGEDDVAWKKFRTAIIERREDYLSGETVRKEMKALEIQATTNTNLQREIELAQENALKVEARKLKALEANKVENMSGDKIAFMAKYGYEDEQDEAKTGNDGDDSERLTSNRDYAAAANLQNVQKLRSGQTQSKKEARQETAKAKADRNAKKDERRKKAGKRERRR